MILAREKNRMTNELKKEWELIVAQPNLYIYGAAKTAEMLYEFITQMGYKENIKGFLVTNSEKNAKEVCGLPVSDVHCFSDKEVSVLVPHMGVYKEQICKLLESLAFNNIYLIGQLRVRTAQEEREYIVPAHREIGWEIYNQKPKTEKEKDAGIREQILTILQEGNPDFGGVRPYQSLEIIGLQGIRPTEYRIREYELRRILKEQDDILDIGCNSGFLDISIAREVRSVTGVEYDNSLVKVANLVANYLKISNCTFYNSDFNEWYRNTSTSYNVIFSFAIHHWLNLDSKEYVAIIDQLLREGGYVCFESHIYGADIEFEECYKKFLELGYGIVCEKKINDDGLQERQYVLFRKRGM